MTLLHRTSNNAMVNFKDVCTLRNKVWQSQRHHFQRAIRDTIPFFGVLGWTLNCIRMAGIVRGSVGGACINNFTFFFTFCSSDQVSEIYHPHQPLSVIVY